MPTTPPSLADINLWDKDRFVEGVPHDWFARMRREAPVCWHEGDADFHGPQGGAGPFWAVTDYHDVVEINRDNATYSSAEKLVFMWDPDDENLEQQRMLMLNMDPPMHTRYRRLINKGFTPRMVSELESTMRKRTRDIIDRVAERGECDFVLDVASELPLQVIADLMGVPQDDRHRLFDWSNRMIGAEDPEYGVTEEMAQQASMELFAYAAELAENKRANPKDDLISVLTQAEVDGERLTGIEIDLFFLLLSVAGNETTRNLISHGMVALLENPGELAKLQANRALLPGAVEEMLRCASPVMNFRRTATRDVEIGGQQIRAGDKVVIWYISANYDESVFENPMKFDIERSPNEHVAFGGGGPHFCLGANLARLEINIMFDEILERLDDLELAGPVSRLRSNFINGLKHVPLKFTVKS
jgi:cholest-4-en-3-one 26-monooxygenase